MAFLATLFGGGASSGVAAGSAAAGGATAGAAGASALGAGVGAAGAAEALGAAIPSAGGAAFQSGAANTFGSVAGASPQVASLAGDLTGVAPGSVGAAGSGGPSMSARLGELIGGGTTGGGIMNVLGSNAPGIVDSVNKSSSLGEFILNASESGVFDGGGQQQAPPPPGEPIQFQPRALPQVKPLSIGEILVGLGVQ